ncbi:hypothetical protein [Sphingomonas sp.]|uniref:hypothetical protein n=1 Tax=Sphingomonas sp. TaxID=28214 RepID=UPI001D6542E8|nr:hypothetical protein [Sphingomonas sp.]MBX9797603.1 hypothetical protein [Sphingomonas sp.]
MLPLAIGACAPRSGQFTLEGITAVRTACPVIAVPAGTGDITLFNPADSTDQSALDVTATITNLRGDCRDAGEYVQTDLTFDVLARRTDSAAARDVPLRYFVTVVQGGTAVVSKRISGVTVHFDAGQTRASVKGEAVASILRSAASLPPEIKRQLTQRRRAGREDAATDPLSRPAIRAAIQRSTFEALVGFQLTDDQLKYNATR